MTMESQKKIVPQEIILNGDGSQNFFTVVKADGTVAFNIKGDGTIEGGDVSQPTGGTFGAVVATETEIGLFGADPVVQPTALTAATAAAAAITHTAPSVQDTALQNLVQNTGFGFVTADEGNSVLAVLKNAVLRIEELEAKLNALGAVATAA